MKSVRNRGPTSTKRKKSRHFWTIEVELSAYIVVDILQGEERDHIVRGDYEGDNSCEQCQGSSIK